MTNLVSEINDEVSKEVGAIPDNCWANVMRVSMENKNLLSDKGSIYVGTGQKNSVTDGAGDTQEICQTKELKGPTKSGMVLGSNGPDSVGSTNYRDISWKPLFTKVTISPNGWKPSASSSGTYSCTIELSKLADANGFNLGHNLVGTYGNIMVQIMTPMQASSGHSRYSIVNTTVDIDTDNDGNDTITIYSNAQIEIAVLIMAIGE